MNEALISEVFLKIINMSISASWLVLAVLLLRLVLKKAPKWVSVLLWGFVAVRLICPFTIESVLSLIPSAETVSPDIMMDWTPEISTGIGSVDTVINPIITQTFAPNPATSANPLQILIPVAGIFWLAGIATMLLYTAVSCFLLRRRVATAVLFRNNIYQSENVDSPFVLGIIKPKIYLPFKMDGKNLEHVIAHEESHIRRKDHWWKPFGFVLLALHWFNPLMWLGYILLCRDIELACDEKVIKEMDNENRADYTQALVACSVNRRRIAACPLAFGEVGVKERVKSVMNYKKPAFWIIIAAIVTCVAVAVCFLTNPKEENDPNLAEDGYYLLIGADGVESIEVSGPNTSGGVVNADESPFKKGEKVWIEQLQGVTDLRGYSITAFDANGEVIYALSIPQSASNEEVVNIVGGDSWLLAPDGFEDSARSDYETTVSATNPSGKYLQDNQFDEYLDRENFVAGLSQSDFISKIENYRYNNKSVEDIAPGMFFDGPSGGGLEYKGELFEFLNEYSVTEDDESARYYNLFYTEVSLDGLALPYDVTFDDTLSVVLQKLGIDLNPQNDFVSDEEDIGKMTLYKDHTAYLKLWNYNLLPLGIEEPTDKYELEYTESYRSTRSDGRDTTITRSVVMKFEQETHKLLSFRVHVLEQYKLEQYEYVEDIDKALSQAILEYNAGDRFKPDGLIKTESHYILGITSKSATPLAGQTNHMKETTVYVQYVYNRYAYSEGKLERVAGIATPAAITFTYDPNAGYTLKEFWEPNGGSAYAQNIRDRFPAEIADIVLDPQDETINTEALEIKCLVQAQEYVSSLTN